MPDKKYEEEGKFYKSHHTIARVFAYGGIVGAFVGVVVTLFNLGAEYLVEYSSRMYDWFYDNPYYIPLLFLALAAAAMFMALVHSRIPEVRGSGVPQTEGVMRGFFTFRWLRVLISTIVLSFVSFFSGLPLGSEGPSVQIGATTAAGASKLVGARLSWQRYLITAGAGAGLSVAFNAPLTGLVFSLEEGHKKITPTLLLTCSNAIIFGTLVYRLLNFAIYGSWKAHVLFELSSLDIRFDNFNLYWMLLLLGLVVGFCAVLFNILLIRTQKWTDKLGKKFPYWARLLLAFTVTGAVGLIPVINSALYGGSSVIKEIYATADFSWYVIMAVLVVKVILLLLCYNSGATGGLFIPMLALGALIGSLVGKMFLSIGMSANYYPMMVCVGMTTFFAASVRTPITATVLIVEITGYSTDFLPAIISIFAAFIVAELLGNRPIYDSMLERYLHINNLDRPQKVHRIEVDVEEGAFIDDRSICDIMWPVNCVVRGIYRGSELLVPEADTRVQGGDVLVIQVETDDLDYTYAYIKGLVTR